MRALLTTALVIAALCSTAADDPCRAWCCGSRFRLLLLHVGCCSLLRAGSLPAACKLLPGAAARSCTQATHGHTRKHAALRRTRHSQLLLTRTPGPVLTRGRPRRAHVRHCRAPSGGQSLACTGRRSLAGARIGFAGTGGLCSWLRPNKHAMGWGVLLQSRRPQLGGRRRAPCVRAPGNLKRRGQNAGGGLGGTRGVGVAGRHHVGTCGAAHIWKVPGHCQVSEGAAPPDVRRARPGRCVERPGGGRAPNVVSGCSLGASLPLKGKGM